jgi:TolB-like protein
MFLVSAFAERLLAQPTEATTKEREWAAVVEFTKDASVQDATMTGTAVAVKLEQALSGRYRLVTRSHINKALQEMRLNLSDLADQQKAQTFGKMVGARYLVTGSIVQIGRQITIAAQIFNVETGEIKQTAEVAAESPDELNSLISELAHILPMTQEEKQKYLATAHEASKLVGTESPRPLGPGKLKATVVSVKKVERLFLRRGIAEPQQGACFLVVTLELEASAFQEMTFGPEKNKACIVDLDSMVVTAGNRQIKVIAEGKDDDSLSMEPKKLMYIYDTGPKMKWCYAFCIPSDAMGLKIQSAQFEALPLTIK